MAAIIRSGEPVQASPVSRCSRAKSCEDSDREQSCKANRETVETDQLRDVEGARRHVGGARHDEFHTAKAGTWQPHQWLKGTIATASDVRTELRSHRATSDCQVAPGLHRRQVGGSSTMWSFLQWQGRSGSHVHSGQPKPTQIHFKPFETVQNPLKPILKPFENGRKEPKPAVADMRGLCAGVD